MTHTAKIVYIPAVQGYHLVCEVCGTTLERNIRIGKYTFSYPGDCEPAETLGVHVEDGVGVEDHFGGG